MNEKIVVPCRYTPVGEAAVSCLSKVGEGGRSFPSCQEVGSGVANFAKVGVGGSLEIADSNKVGWGGKWMPIICGRRHIPSTATHHHTVM